MFDDIQNALALLLRSKNQWDKIYPQVAQNSGASDINNELEKIEILLRSINNETNINGVAWNIASQQLNALTSHIGNPSKFNNVFSTLWTLNNALLDAIPFDQSLHSNRTKGINADIAAEAELVKKYLSESTKIIQELNSILKTAQDLKNELNSLHSNAERMENAITKHQNSISTLESQSKHQTEISANHLKEMKEHLDQIKQDQINQREIFNEFENRREEVQSLLENANKVGLARSFQLKSRQLTRMWKVWAGLFIFGIMILTFLGHKIIPLIVAPEPNYLLIGFRILSVTPIVWFAWFSARQYSHTLRIAEDYSFKEASAMAFAGYRNEVTTDPEMLKLLRQNAIKNFGDNPAKVLLAPADSSSPIGDAVVKLVNKLKPSDIINLFKSK